jgi:hypothetical protein
MISWLSKGEDRKLSGAATPQRGGATGRRHGPRRCAGPTSLPALDQEAAMGHVQWTIGSTRRGGRAEHDRVDQWLNIRGVKFNGSVPAESDIADRQSGNSDAELHHRYRRSLRSRPVAGHAAIARNLAVAADALSARFLLKRLHPQCRGAKDRDEKPCDAFHTSERHLPYGGPRAKIIPKRGPRSLRLARYSVEFAPGFGGSRGV